MTGKVKLGKATTADILKMEAAIRRQEEITNGRVNYNRVQTSKKTYNRKPKHKLNFA